MSSLEFASSWSLMNIVFSFHFVLPVLCSMFEKMVQFLGNYRIFACRLMFFLHGSAWSTIFEYFVIFLFFILFFFTFNGLPSWQSWQPIWWEKILSLFFFRRYYKFLVKTLHLECSNLFLVPGREVHKEWCCLYLTDIFVTKLISLSL